MYKERGKNCVDKERVRSTEGKSNSIGEGKRCQKNTEIPERSMAGDWNREVR